MIRPDRVLGAIKRKCRSLLFLHPLLVLILFVHLNLLIGFFIQNKFSMVVTGPVTSETNAILKLFQQDPGDCGNLQGSPGKGSSPDSLTFDRKSGLIRIQYGSR